MGSVGSFDTGSEVRSNVEGSDDIRDMSEQDLSDNARILSEVGAVQSRYESAANADDQMSIENLCAN